MIANCAKMLLIIMFLLFKASLSHSSVFDLAVDNEQEEDIDQMAATLIVIDISSGIKTILRVTDNKIANFKSLSLKLQYCWHDSAKVYKPESRALIEIKDDQNVVFKGWLFSQHRTLTQAAYKNRYFFYLDKCS